MASAKEPKGPAPAEAHEGPTAQAPPAAAAAQPRNTMQRAASVIKRLKLSAPVAAGVLAQHGLTPTSMVEPSTFESQVAAWLAAPASN